MTTMLWIWVAVICASAIIEAISTDMTSIWVTCGGIVGIILYAIWPDNILVQIIPASVVTILLIIFIRPIVRKTLKNKTTKTNADSLVGQKFKLLTDIKDNELGTVKINGVVWSVESEDNNEINAGEEILICQIKGNKLIATKATSAQQKEDDAEQEIQPTKQKEKKKKNKEEGE